MKQTLIPLLAFAIICFSSCASKDVKYVINGTNAPKEGARVYLIDKARRAPIDSAVVSGGTFTMKGKAETYIESVQQRLSKYILPAFGTMPVSDIKPSEVLELCRKIENRGYFEAAKRVKNVISQICRFAIASGWAENDPTFALNSV